MATNLDFSRAVNLNMKISKDRLIDAVLVFSRTDGGSVSWSGIELHDMHFDIYNSVWDSTPVVELENQTDFVVSTNTITFQKAITTLSRGVYFYKFYTETTNQAVAYGKFEII
jgi:hypothetical protein